MRNKIVSKVRQALRTNADEKTKSSGRRFFKEEVKLYGVKASKVSKIAGECFEDTKGLSKKEVFAICEDLFSSGLCEESWIASSWAYRLRGSFAREDFKIFEKWIGKYVDNWASCDTFCNHTIGSFIEKFPVYISELKKWTLSRNRWFRRAAAVSLIVPAKKVMFKKDIFEIAGRLLEDEDDMVQKGYGWLLKDLSKARQKEVFDYVIKHKERMPRTSLRYAIERMPQNLRIKAMGK